MRDVKKRDGRIVAFDENRIREAISRASAEVGIVDEPLVEKIVEKVKSLAEKKNLDVEQIQDAVERELMKSSRKDVAKAYIAYRHQRNLARKAKSRDLFMSVVNIENNETTRENANVGSDSPNGILFLFGSETSREFAVDYLLSRESAAARQANYIYPADMTMYSTRSLTCLHHPLDRFLEKGFKEYGIRPAKKLESAFSLAALSLETIQSEQHGGQSLGCIDVYLEKYVRMAYEEEFEKASELFGYDINLSVRNREIKDYEKKDLSGIQDPFERIRQHSINKCVDRLSNACKAFIHEMNSVRSRAGAQPTFSSINYGTSVSAEGRAIIRELLLQTQRGVGNGETAIFPIQVFKLKEGVSKNPGDPNYDLYQLACEVTARRFYPNFLNLDSSYNRDDSWDENDPKRHLHEVATMGKH